MFIYISEVFFTQKKAFLQNKKYINLVPVFLKVHTYSTNLIKNI